MEKIKFKFALSIAFFTATSIIVFFFEEIAYELEHIFLPVFFTYFLIDSLTVIIPYFNDSIFSGKLFVKLFKEIPTHSIDRLKSLKEKNNRIALLIFVLYFGGLTIIGVLYLNIEAISRLYIYVLFLALNVADYFCILIWCPFRSIFLKNKCCNTCRISNWDRIMKFYILFFIPNIYTLSLAVTGVIVFIIWEYSHFSNPERFYTISNKTLLCAECNDILCKKKKSNQ